MKPAKLNARLLSRLGSCGVYGMAMLEVAEQMENVVAITADLRTFSGLDRYASKFPDRFFNAGIAEQDMVGMAAGMAKEGFIPFVSSYATFVSMRAADQMRVNMGYMNLPIKAVGLTSGLSVGVLGPTHICLEDMSISRSFPNVTVLSPADCVETYHAVMAAAEHENPVYLRLTGAQNQPIVYTDVFDYEIGKAQTLREGDDVAIIATGTMVYESIRAAESLEEKGIGVKVVDMHTIKPLDTEAVEACLDCALMVTVEEHGIVGGLGSAVAEHLALSSEKPPQLIIGCDGHYEHAGNYEYLLGRYGLTGEQIANRVLEVWERW